MAKDAITYADDDPTISDDTAPTAVADVTPSVEEERPAEDKIADEKMAAASEVEKPAGEENPLHLVTTQMSTFVKGVIEHFTPRQQQDVAAPAAAPSVEPPIAEEPSDGGAGVIPMTILSKLAPAPAPAAEAYATAPEPEPDATATFAPVPSPPAAAPAPAGEAVIQNV